MAAEPSDELILAAIQERDPEAVAMLYDRYGRLAFSLAVRVLNDEGAAEDVVQEAFLNVWRQAARFDLNRGSVRTWLLTIVRNRAIDRRRGRPVRYGGNVPLEEVELSLESADVWPEVSTRLEREAIQQALISLSAAQRQAIELAYFGGYTYPEIASMTDTPLGTVKSRLRLGLEKLRGALIAQGIRGVGLE
jgi:RNA polymerase sigma-70 factor (ECF subfamily)